MCVQRYIRPAAAFSSSSSSFYYYNTQRQISADCFYKPYSPIFCIHIYTCRLDTDRFMYLFYIGHCRVNCRAVQVRVAAFSAAVAATVLRRRHFFIFFSFSTPNPQQQQQPNRKYIVSVCVCVCTINNVIRHLMLSGVYTISLSLLVKLLLIFFGSHVNRGPLANLNSPSFFLSHG